MKTLLQSAAILLFASVVAQAQNVVIADNYNVTGSGTGFGLNAGLNTGINPPATRLTGTAAPGLSYLFTQPTTGTYKAATKYSITSKKAQIAASSYNGRFSLSADGTTAFDFGSALGATSASAAAPATYDVSISMANTINGTQRFSFGLGTTEGAVDVYRFGVQLYRANASDTVYTIGTLINGVKTPVTTTDSYASGTELNFLMHFTDVGGESDGTYHSRVELYVNGTEIYDTAADSSLVNGWGFGTTARIFDWDQAGAAGATGNVTYDNFSVTLVPEPSALALAALGGVAMSLRRRRQ